MRQRTFGELYSDVSRLAAAMKSIGVKSGDRVVGQYSVAFSTLCLYLTIKTRIYLSTLTCFSLLSLVHQDYY